jgi:hypothetical protein
LAIKVVPAQVQVAIGKMFDMFIVHDHNDLRLLKVPLRTFHPEFVHPASYH